MMSALMSPTDDPTPRPTPADEPRAAHIGGALLLLTIVSALFYYKWGGSLRAWGTVQETGKLSANPAPLLDGGVLAATAAYFLKIWPALVYGILVGAAVRAAVPASWVARALGGRGVRGSLLGGVAGSPLMLCSCCVTPIFTGVYERGARLGPSLALMLAAPGLNLAALALTFALLPPGLGVARVAFALVVVFGASTVLARVFEGSVAAPQAAACAAGAEERMTLGRFAVRFLRSVVYLTAVTVPLILAGVVLSGIVLPRLAGLAGTGVFVAVALVALVGVLVALPTFFEIPIAMLLLQLGAPVGAAAAFLVAGPIINLPSLFVLARETRPRVALAMGAAVWVASTLAGVAVSF
jgi:hypothetical protein